MSNFGEGELSDVSISESVSSWADAQADTPTLGENQSNSEDTLSSLSFDENEVLSPVKSPLVGSSKMTAVGMSLESSRALSFQPPVPASRSNSKKTEILLNSTPLSEKDTNYVPPSVDFPKSPRELKTNFGSLLQSDDDVAESNEEDLSFASSSRAKLHLNLANGGVGLRLTKKEEENRSNNSKNQLTVPEYFESEPSSLLPDSDVLEDYIEDFYLPLSHESVMSRQTSFRRKVQKQLESATTDSAFKELSKFDTMLSTYDEESEGDVMEQNAKKTNPKTESFRSVKNGPKNNFKTYEEGAESEMPSLLDIDALCDKHAPHLMSKMQSMNFESSDSILIGDSEESGYYIPKITLGKLYSVYDSNNFNNLYTLSGELKHILSPVEIEEIVANKVHLEKVVDPNVLAALSWSLNEASLPAYDLSLSPHSGPINNSKDVESKASSISNGFHSRNTSDASDDESTSVVSKGESFKRNLPQTASFRRRIALAKSLQTEIGGLEVAPSETPSASSPSPTMKNSSSRNWNWRSLESLEDLDIETDGENGGGGGDEGRVYLVRRDSKRFSQRDSTRVVEGLFVETSSNSGTLRRIKAPLNISVDDGEMGEMEFSELASPIDGKTSPKRRVAVDDDALNTYRSEEGDDDVTQSELFHSCYSKTVHDEDPTICSNSPDEHTLDLDTPDDMADSILGKLESVKVEKAPENLEQEGWKSFSVGDTEIHIDLKAIQPYRRVLSHGGYFDAEKKVAIILFSGCYLPDRSRKEYSYLMDHLFLYVLSTLEELIVDDYMLVYLHGATPKSCQPSFGWLKRCYQLIDHKLRKNLKGLFLVHPSFWLKTVVALTKPFISTKFSRKVQFVENLAELCLELPTEHLVIPEPVLKYDFDMKVHDLKRNKHML